MDITPNTDWLMETSRAFDEISQRASEQVEYLRNLRSTINNTKYEDDEDLERASLLECRQKTDAIMSSLSLIKVKNIITR